MGRSFSMQPLPGKPIKRDGKPFIWVTWLAKALGGKQCLWAPWFAANYRYAKYETQGPQLAEWNRDHSRLMRDTRAEMERLGYACTSEDQNDFKLEGATAVVAGKPDLIAIGHGQAIVIDGKTGRERESDIWQVLIYAYALQRIAEWKDRFQGLSLSVELRYKSNPGEPMTFGLEALNEKRVDDIVAMVKTLASPDAPTKAPSRFECKICNIGHADCPVRLDETRPAADERSSSLALGF